MINKEGIDYFPVKCTTDNALNLVMYECGLKSHAEIGRASCRERV